MKKTMLLFVSLMTAFAVQAAKPQFLSGDAGIFKSGGSFYVEFDYSESSFDGLESEAAYIEYKTQKEKTKAKQWEKSWATDKKNMETFYIECLNHAFKKTTCKYNGDDPGSDYKVVVKPVHIETGTLIKVSSVEFKWYVYDAKTNELLAEIHIPRVAGVKQGPTTPTTGIRMKAAANMSSRYFAKFIKKEIKKMK